MIVCAKCRVQSRHSHRRLALPEIVRIATNFDSACFLSCCVQASSLTGTLFRLIVLMIQCHTHELSA